MKQSTNNIGMTQGNIQKHLSSFFSEYEIEVAEIILNLPSLISESQSRNRVRETLNWGAKRRRSSTYSMPPSLCLSSLSPPLQATCQDERDSEIGPQVKVEAMSPATPLSFSPSESDDKPKNCLSKNCKKRTRKELLEIVESLTECGSLLRGEVANVTMYLNQLKAENLALKAKRKELTSSLKKEESHLEINSDPNHGINAEQHSRIPAVTHKQQPFIMNPTANSSHLSDRFQYPCGQTLQLLPSHGRLGTVGQIGQVGIPDLNVSVDKNFRMEASRPLDPIKALRIKAAEARLRRMKMIKEKRQQSIERRRFR